MKLNAIGRNIFPSIPRRLRIGRKTMMTTRPAKRTGRPTSRLADRKTRTGTDFFSGWAAA